jgi:peptidoglycan/LPS O-acetylase OafA/YrhL
LLILLTPQNSQLVSFVSVAGGALIFQAWAKGWLAPHRAAPLLVLAGLLLGMLTLRPESEGNLRGLVAMVALFSSPHAFILGVGALLLLAGVLMWPSAQRYLEMRACQFLGRISFALYLIHIPLLGTVTCFMYSSLGMDSLQLAQLAAGYLVLCLTGAYLLTRLVDEPVTSALKYVRQLPRSTRFWTPHIGLIACMLAFVVWRLGLDPLSLLVATIGYAGVALVMPLVLLQCFARRRRMRPALEQ